MATRQTTNQAYRIEENERYLHLWQQDVLIKHTE
jgi:hypothetical protein